MKMYHDKETTPLKFHKVFWRVVLPIEFFVNLCLFISLLFNGNPFYYPKVIALALRFIELVLSLTAFIGFFRWTKSAWYCAMVYPCLEIIFNLFFLFFAVFHLPEDVRVWAKDVVYCSVIATTIVLYYYKRKLLFSAT